MVKEWLHINGSVGDTWILPIKSAIGNAVKEGRMIDVDQDIHELGGYIWIKLNMLDRIANRIKKERESLYEEAKNRKPGRYEFTKNKKGCAFPVDDDIKYQLLIDIDSLLFELNSCCELMSEFIRRIYNHTGIRIEKKDIGKKIKSIIRDKNGNLRWFIDLDKNRNFFIHKGAPYIAVDLSNKLEYDLLIMKENLRAFDNEEKFIRLSTLAEIVAGFLEARAIFKEHLIQYIKSLK